MTSGGNIFNDFPENQLYVSYERSNVKTACKKLAADRPPMHGTAGTMDNPALH